MSCPSCRTPLRHVDARTMYLSQPCPICCDDATTWHVPPCGHVCCAACGTRMGWHPRPVLRDVVDWRMYRDACQARQSLERAYARQRKHHDEVLRCGALVAAVSGVVTFAIGVWLLIPTRGHVPKRRP